MSVAGALGRGGRMLFFVSLLLAPAVPLGGSALAAATGSYPNPAVITIPGKPSSLDPAPAAPYPSVIAVSGEGTVKKVTVTIIGFEHQELYDVDILLVGPKGQKVILMAYISGDTAVDLKGATWTFDDAASAKLPQKGAPPTTGTFKPSSYRTHSDETFAAPAPDPPYKETLSAFNGTDPNGAWKLYVMDTLGTYGGRITGGWTLNINGSGGGSGPPAAMCNGRKATIKGSGTINGTLHPDVIVGSEGDDKISGSDSDDVICGLGGNDTIGGGRNDDWIDGGDGKDVISGSDQDDTILGGNGKDVLKGDKGNDKLGGGPGNDLLYGGSGSDQLAGQEGKDGLDGGTGKDALSGGPGNDGLTGGSGSDSLDGGEGNDLCQAAQVPSDKLIRCEDTF